jgi:hypothetical protein
MGGLTFLPFVRDSRSANAAPPAATPASKKAPAPAAEKKAEKPVGEKKAEKPSVAPSEAVPAAQPVAVPVVVAEVAQPAPSGPAADLAALIVAVGEEIRALKTAKVCECYELILLSVINIFRLIKMPSKVRSTSCWC